MKPELRQRFEASGQAHVFSRLDELTVDQTAQLVQSLERVETTYMVDAFPLAQKADEQSEPTTIEPLASSASWDARWRQLGLVGQVAALVLAGGQGTRLGFDGPKGCFDVGLPSSTTLFGLFCARLKRLGELAGTTPPLLVMTSDLNEQETKDYFDENDFGVDVRVFSQETIPAFDLDGKLFMSSGYELAMAPDGNGGVYRALAASGALDDLRERGVKYVHVFSVDNALCRPCDPVFVGYAASVNALVASKVVWKSSPHEKVGVLAVKNGKPAVVEYSELPKELAEATVDGKLKFGAGNICNHLLSIDFLTAAATAKLPYHVARKKIVKDGVKPDQPNAIKLEAFIFDAFALADHHATLDVPREDDFAPVKNATGNDSPQTARAALLAQGKRWLEAAGATVIGDFGVEVSPTLSYDGEGLDMFKGRVFDTTEAPLLLAEPL